MIIAICDDERKDIETVAKVCREAFSEHVEIYAYLSAESLIRNLTNTKQEIDLFILDIEMPGKDGFWLKRTLEQYHYGSSIIFFTNHDEWMRNAFGRYVIGFVDKVSFRKDKSVLTDKLNAFEQALKMREMVQIKDEKGNFCIPKDTIIQISSEHVYTYVEFITGKVENGRLQTEKKLVRKPLRVWEQELGEGFLRTGNRHIVNMDFIRRIGKTVLLKDGSDIKIPLANQKKCQDKYFAYCDRKMKWE